MSEHKETNSQKFGQCVFGQNIWRESELKLSTVGVHDHNVVAVNVAEYRHTGDANNSPIVGWFCVSTDERQHKSSVFVCVFQICSRCIDSRSIYYGQFFSPKC